MKCPHCNTKMKWDGCVCTSNPPKYMHKCPKCGHIIYADTYDPEDREDNTFHCDDIMKEQMELVGSITLDAGKSKAEEYSIAARDVMYESFRAKAAMVMMQGFVISDAYSTTRIVNDMTYQEQRKKWDKETMAREAVAYADALIAELKKGK